MARYIARRLLGMIPLLLGVSVVIFALIRLIPGDPVVIMIGAENASVEEVARLRRVLGLDQGLHVQYLRFLGRILRGDLGRSLASDEPVALLIRERLPATIELTLAATTIALAIAIPAGVLAAVRRYSAVDTASTVGALLGVSMPNFWLGVMLIFLFALRLGWLPASGRGEPVLAGVGSLLVTGNPAGLATAATHLILPAVTLGSALAAVVTRLMRSSMLEVIGQDYIRTARAKGLRGGRVVLRHALRNALIPVVTVVGLEFGALLGGAVITETIFAWPGIGRLAIRSIVQRDFPVVQGVVLMIAVVRVLANLCVDVAYAAIDPRIRYA
ncbi:MAG: ABC transporter permease [Armatimonadota bacterium]|nr:ABC transporter permease [Armatimonadota bacterium]MDR7453546.1 ABC transporter permease [Armatimonadota bacterium]MDR7455684.1 ABC transporter permease [Armatimonadota bacterium]MDR7497473.1 ABC transporter permease [Armatimonadota bacterium]MDR7512540.1 ABC transporter permease [Armatimonadota bacterium]